MEQQAVSLDALEVLKQKDEFLSLDNLLLPADCAVMHLAKVEMAASEQFYMLQGQPVQIPGSPTDGVVRMYGESGSFLGIGEILDDGRVGPKRLIATN